MISWYSDTNYNENYSYNGDNNGYTDDDNSSSNGNNSTIIKATITTLAITNTITKAPVATASAPT